MSRARASAVCRQTRNARLGRRSPRPAPARRRSPVRRGGIASISLADLVEPLLQHLRVVLRLRPRTRVAITRAHRPHGEEIHRRIEQQRRAAGTRRTGRGSAPRRSRAGTSAPLAARPAPPRRTPPPRARCPSAGSGQPRVTAAAAATTSDGAVQSTQRESASVRTSRRGQPPAREGHRTGPASPPRARRGCREDRAEQRQPLGAPRMQREVLEVDRRPSSALPQHDRRTATARRRRPRRRAVLRDEAHRGSGRGASAVGAGARASADSGAASSASTPAAALPPTSSSACGPGPPSTATSSAAQPMPRRPGPGRVPRRASVVGTADRRRAGGRAAGRAAGRSAAAA